MKFIKFLISIFLLISLFISAGCTDQAQLNDLKKQVKELKEQVKNIDSNSFEHAIKLDQIEEKRQYINLDVSSKSY